MVEMRYAISQISSHEFSTTFYFHCQECYEAYSGSPRVCLLLPMCFVSMVKCVCTYSMSMGHHILCYMSK